MLDSEDTRDGWDTYYVTETPTDDEKKDSNMDIPESSQESSEIVSHIVYPEKNHQNDDDKISDLLSSLITTPANLALASREIEKQNQYAEKNRKRGRDSIEEEVASEEEYYSEDFPQQKHQDSGFNINSHIERESKKPIVRTLKRSVSGGGNNNAVKVEIEPHIDPIKLVCKDSLPYIHLEETSVRLPSSGDGMYGRFPNFKKYTPPPKNDKNDLYFDIIRASGNLSRDDSKFGTTRGYFSNKDCGVPEEAILEIYPKLRNGVIKGLPIRSPLFGYNFTVYKRRDANRSEYGTTIGDYDVWHIEKCEIYKNLLDLDDLDYFIQKCVALEGDMADSFKEEMLYRYPVLSEGDEINFLWQDYEEILKSLKWTVDMHDRPIPELIRYIFADEYSYLAKFYPDIVILNMKPRDMIGVYKELKENPFDLFFFRMTNFIYRIVRSVKDPSRLSQPGQTAVTSNGNNIGIRAEEVTEEISDELDQRDDLSDDLEVESTTRLFLDQLVLNGDAVHDTYINRDNNTEIFWIYLPELGTEHIKLLDTDKLSKRQRAIIKVYNTLKDSYYRDFNTLCYDDQLKVHIDYTHGPQREHEFKYVMDYLCTTPIRGICGHKSSTRKPTLVKYWLEGYYLYESYLDTQTMVESISILFERYITRKKLEMKGSEMSKIIREIYGEDNERSFRTSIVEDISPLEIDVSSEILGQFDSQQLRGCMLFLKSPLVVVCGGGGSGKTWWIHMMRKCIKEDEALLLSHQGSNVSQLVDTFYGRAYTFHNFSHIHKRCCVTQSWSTKNVNRWNSSNGDARDFTTLKDCGGVAYKRCPFERIKVLFIEEASLVSHELISLALAILMQCAQLEKLIITGDHGQCRSIGPGQFMKEIRKVAEQIGTCVELIENHRSGNGVIFKNSRAVLEGDASKFVFDNDSCNIRPFSLEYRTGKDFVYGQEATKIIAENKIPQYQSTVLAHTNDIVDSINAVVESHYLNIPCNASNYLKLGRIFHIGSKIVFKANLYIKDNLITNNTTFIVKNITDYKPLKKDAGVRSAEFVKSLTNNEEINHVRKSDDRKSFTGCRRRLYVKHMDHISKDSEFKYLPFFGIYRNKHKKAYCTTIHGAQGREYDYVLLMMPFDSPAWTREMVYTAVTRAKKKLFFVGDISALENAINRPEPDRLTHLSLHLVHAIQSKMSQGWKNWNPQADPIYGQLYDGKIYLEEFKDEIFEEERSVEVIGPTRITTVLGLIFSKCFTMDKVSQLYRLRQVSKMFRRAVDDAEMWIWIYEMVRNNTVPLHRHLMTDTILYKKKMLGLDGTNADTRVGLINVAESAIGYVGPQIFVCKGKSGKICNYGKQYFITSASIISAMMMKYDTIQKREALGFVSQEELEKIELKLKVCPCGVEKHCSIVFKKMPFVQIIKDPFILGRNYKPVFATINIDLMSNTERREVSIIEVPVQRYHPEYLHKNNKIGTNMIPTNRPVSLAQMKDVLGKTQSSSRVTQTPMTGMAHVDTIDGDFY